MSNRFQLTLRTKISLAILLMACLIGLSITYICILLPIGINVSSIASHIIGYFNRKLWKLLRKEGAVVSLKTIDARARYLVKKIKGVSSVTSKLPPDLQTINTWQEAKALEGTLHDEWPLVYRISTKVLRIVKRVYFACPKDLQNKVVIAWARSYYLGDRVIVQSRFMKLVFEQFLKNRKDLEMYFSRKQGST